MYNWFECVISATILALSSYAVLLYGLTPTLSKGEGVKRAFFKPSPLERVG